MPARKLGGVGGEAAGHDRRHERRHAPDPGTAGAAEPRRRSRRRGWHARPGGAGRRARRAARRSGSRTRCTSGKTAATARRAAPSPIAGAARDASSGTVRAEVQDERARQGTCPRRAEEELVGPPFRLTLRRGQATRTRSRERRMPSVSMTVNGKSVSGEVEGRTLLVQFLRENLGLTGTHVGCDTSQCGACVVHVNGDASNPARSSPPPARAPRSRRSRAWPTPTAASASSSRRSRTITGCSAASARRAW